MDNAIKRLHFGACFTFLIAGFSVLIVGTIMPHLIAECNINYTTAGSFLSCYAIGNLLASFFYPLFANKFGRKTAIVILSSLVPISYGFIATLPSVSLISLAFLLAGIGRGSISNTNNIITNELAPGKSAALNILHTFFAVGAFIAPLLTSFYLRLGYDWKSVMMTAVILNVCMVITYACTPFHALPKSAKDLATSDSKVKPTSPFLKNSDFYVVSFLLFFYLGLENCVNGWFVTYLKSTDVMSVTYATNLVGALWIVIIAGRLYAAFLATKISKQKLILINSIGCLIAFICLIMTDNLSFITCSMVALGFFMAGIYPTCMANAGLFIRGSINGMAFLLAIAALGGIIMPQIIGIIADYIGMTGAMAFLSSSVLIMLLLAVINFKRDKKAQIQ